MIVNTVVATAAPMEIHDDTAHILAFVLQRSKTCESKWAAGVGSSDIELPTTPARPATNLYGGWADRSASCRR
jgi:hypothetical protein